MADFDKIVDFVINRNEGKYQQTKKDSGNYPKGHYLDQAYNFGTKYGISAKTLWLNKMEWRADRIAAMTKKEAKEFYRKWFWDPSGLAKIKSNAIAYQLFDHLINAGSWENIKLPLLKKYPWFRGGGAYKLSDKEIESINQFGGQQFYKDLQLQRVIDYQNDSADHRARPFRWLILDYNYPQKKSLSRSDLIKALGVGLIIYSLKKKGYI